MTTRPKQPWTRRMEEDGSTGRGERGDLPRRVEGDGPTRRGEGLPSRVEEDGSTRRGERRDLPRRVEGDGPTRRGEGDVIYPGLPRRVEGDAVCDHDLPYPQQETAGADHPDNICSSDHFTNSGDRSENSRLCEGFASNLASDNHPGKIPATESKKPSKRHRQPKIHSTYDLRAKGSTVDHTATRTTIHLNNIGNLQIGPNNVMINNYGSNSGHRTRREKTRKLKKLTDSSRPVTESDVHNISQYIGDKWMELARHLGFKQGEIDMFDHDNRLQREKIIRMLNKWREKEPTMPLAVLAQLLAELNLYDAAEIL